MKLSIWAKENGLSYLTAYRLFKAGKLPVNAHQLETGTILVDNPNKELKTVLYARVSSHDQKEDLNRQLDRIRQYAFKNNIPIYNEFKEIGSGVNPNRAKLLQILKDPKITTIIVEHRDRLTRFGFEMIQAALWASGRNIIVVEKQDLKDDLVQDLVDIVTSFCAKIYGKRSAKNKAKKALEAIEK